MPNEPFMRQSACSALPKYEKIVDDNKCVTKDWLHRGGEAGGSSNKFFEKPFNFDLRVILCWGWFVT